MGLRFEPLVILGIGFIQIESVKSVVKNQGLGLVAAPPRQVKQSEFALVRACQPKPWRRLVIRGPRLDRYLGDGFSWGYFASNFSIQSRVCFNS